MNIWKAGLNEDNECQINSIKDTHKKKKKRNVTYKTGYSDTLSKSSNSNLTLGLCWEGIQAPSRSGQPAFSAASVNHITGVMCPIFMHGL